MIITSCSIHLFRPNKSIATTPVIQYSPSHFLRSVIGIDTMIYFDALRKNMLQFRTYFESLMTLSIHFARPNSENIMIVF